MAGVKTNFCVVGYNDNVTEGDCEAETEANKVKSILHNFIDEGQHSIASCLVLVIMPVVVWFYLYSSLTVHCLIYLCETILSDKAETVCQV